MQQMLRVLERIPSNVRPTTFCGCCWMQSEVLALKGLGLIAALGGNAAEHALKAPEAGRLGCDQGGIRGLLELLVVTMAAHPLSCVRNAAHYAMGALVDSLEVGSRRMTASSSDVSPPHGPTSLS